MATVLVVDDDPDLLQIATEVLRQDGHQVLTARSGEEALAALDRDRSIDLLLTDVILPGVDGFMLADAATRRHAALRVMFMSGCYTQVPLETQLRDAGTVLTKPWRANDFSSQVKAFLAGRH